MNIGIGISLANYRPVPTVPLDPDAAIAALFESGEVGAWYDPSDSTTVWQDAAGTTPATVGDPVGRIDDKSGNGNHATQSTSAARPVLQQSGGLYYLDFDGVDDSITTGAFAAGAQAQPVTCGVAIKSDVLGREEHFFDSANISSARLFFRSYTVSSVFRYEMYANVFLSNIGTATTNSVVASTHFNTSASLIRINGSDFASGNAGTWSWDSLRLGANNAATAGFLNGRIYSFVGVNRTLTAAEITDLETYLAAKSGVTL